MQQWPQWVLSCKFSPMVVAMPELTKTNFGNSLGLPPHAHSVAPEHSSIELPVGRTKQSWEGRFFGAENQTKLHVTLYQVVCHSVMMVK